MEKRLKVYDSGGQFRIVARLMNSPKTHLDIRLFANDGLKPTSKGLKFDYPEGVEWLKEAIREFEKIMDVRK